MKTTEAKKRNAQKKVQKKHTNSRQNNMETTGTRNIKTIPKDEGLEEEEYEA